MQAKLIGDNGSYITRYELFTNETTKDVNGEDVIIPKSIGKYSLAQLERMKAEAQGLVNSAQAKIDAIGAITNE